MGFAYCDFHHQGAAQMLMARAVARPRSLQTSGSARSVDASRAEISARVETPAVESSRLDPVKSETRAKAESAKPENALELRRSTD